MNHFVYFLRKTLYQGALKFLACVILLLFFSASLFAGNYTWNGTTNNNWGTASNWSGGIVPGNNDTITINSGKPNLKLDQDRTVNRIVQNGSTIDIDTNQLYVTQRATFNGGDVIGESLKLRGTYVYFQGTDFNCTLDVVVGQIKFSGGTFDQTGTFEQNGGASGWGAGGCVFNDSVTIKNSGATYLRMGETTGDIFNDKVTFISTGVYALQLSYGDTSQYNGNVFINCTGNGGLSFCAGTNAAAIIGAGKSLSAGSSGLTAGVITLKNIVQSDSTTQSIITTGTSTLSMQGCSFTGAITVSTPSLLVKTSTFYSAATFTKTGNATNHWEGGNVFYGTTTINNNTTGSGILRMALQAGDVYAGDVTFNTSTGYIQVAFADTSTFGGDVTTNNSKVGFSSGSGLLQFNGEEDQALTTAAIISAQKFMLTKPGGLLTTNRQITIDSVLTLTGGILSTDSLITLKAPAIVNGGSNLSHVDGPVKKIGNTAFVFPVGDQGQWNPVEISAPAQTTDAFTARFYLEGQPYGSAADTTIRLLNTCSYWNLTRTTGSSNVYVSLYWDSIACGLYDTTGLIVAALNGTTWKNVEKEGITGNVMAGKIKSFTLTNYYSSFTWGYEPDPGQPIIIPINPVLNTTTSDPSWNHPISEDYFGYNGSSVLDEGQYWSDLSSNAVLLHNGISSIRHNGGTNGNYWDWRTGWFIPENELPNDWFYLKRSHKKPFPDLLPNGTFVNEMQYFKISNDAVAGRPIFQFNNLTSGFNYELASLYRAHELNLPVKYVELGNEFYFNDEHYKEVFPSSYDYINYANAFTDALKSKVPFADVQVAVVGSSFSENSAGRRSLWLETILSNIHNVTHRPDAITIHEYYTSGLSNPIDFGPYNIGQMFIKPFIKGDDLIANELQAVEDRSSALGLNPPLEVWLTEYNMNDDVSNNVGTWAHGLFNAIQTLKYLESPLITHLSSHAMTSDAVYGNIFESNRGFQNLAEGQLPENVKLVGAGNFETTPYGFTASGAAQNEIALAMKGTGVEAHRIDFSPNSTAIGNISYFDANGNYVTSSNLLNLYGWSFEKEEGFEAIILNLGQAFYSIGNPSDLTSINSITNVPQSMVQLTTIDPTTGLGSVVKLPVANQLNNNLYTTGEINIANGVVSIPPHSLTRIIYRNPGTITLRLTDDEICEGTTTSVLVQGANFNSTITLEVKQGSTTVYSNSISDSLFHLPTNLDPGTYTLFANDGSVTSDPVNLIIHPAISVMATAETSEPCADIPEITLSANVTTSNQNSNLSHSYSYLWVPDGEITDHNPFQQSININNINMKTNAYQVFVYDGYCWASSNIIELDRGPVSVDLGNDFTVCDNNVDFDLRANTTLSPMVNTGTLHYKWYENNIEIPSATTADITVPNPGIGIVPWTYKVQVWSDNGVDNNEGCPQWDEITVNVVPCCSCSSAVELNPHAYSVFLETVETVYNVSHIEDLISAIENSTTLTYLPDALTKTVTISPGSSGTPTICINGEFWVKNFVNINSDPINTIIIQNCTLRLGEDVKIKVRGLSKLILKGCLVESCSTSTMWDGLYVDIYDQAVKEPELEITESLITSNRTIIRDAKNALVLRRDSPFMIEKCDFDNNYVDVLMEKYNKSMSQDRSGNGVNAFSQKNYIRSCSFSKTGTLLAPYTGSYKLAGIRLRDVERVVIGDSSMHSNISANTFSDASYGIMAYNAGFECYNNTFSNINYDVDGASVEEKHKGSCIYSYSESDYNDRKTIIGSKNFNSGAPASHKNIFTLSVNGIVSVGEMNLKVFNNEFGNGNTNDRILNYGIWTFGTKNKEVFISRENKFYDYNVGIRANEIYRDGAFNIADNKFYNAFLNPPLLGRFEGTAIIATNRFTPTPPIGELAFADVHPLQILKNTIGEDNGNSEPRLGIVVGSIFRPVIQENKIYFTRTGNTNLLTSRGIWMQASFLPYITLNEIIQTEPTVFGFNDNLIGIRSDVNVSPCISSNFPLQNLGHGISFAGSNGRVALALNIFDECDFGVHMTDAEIGTQGTANRTDDNEWVDNPSSSNNRVVGSTKNGPIAWNYNDNFNLFSPLPSFIVNPFPNPTPSIPTFNCPSLQNVVARNLSFGPVVADTARYAEDFANSFSYSSKYMTFKAMKGDSSIVIMDDESDVLFIEFYNAMSQSNLEKYDSVAFLIYKKDIAAASALLSGIEDTNDQESYLTIFYTLYLSKIIYDSTLSAEDSASLLDMAYSNPLLYGDAVYLARNTLFLEVHDEPLSSNLRRPNFRRQNFSSTIKIHPNPSINYSIVKLNGELYSGKLQILDGMGHLIKDIYISNGMLDIQTMSSGIYLIRISYENQSPLHCKLIIVR